MFLSTWLLLFCVKLHFLYLKEYGAEGCAARLIILSNLNLDMILLIFVQIQINQH